MNRDSFRQSFAGAFLNGESPESTLLGRYIPNRICDHWRITGGQEAGPTPIFFCVLEGRNISDFGGPDNPPGNTSAFGNIGGNPSGHQGETSYYNNGWTGSPVASRLDAMLTPGLGKLGWLGTIRADIFYYDAGGAFASERNLEPQTPALEDIERFQRIYPGYTFKAANQPAPPGQLPSTLIVALGMAIQIRNPGNPAWSGFQLYEFVDINLDSRSWIALPGTGGVVGYENSFISA